MLQIVFSFLVLSQSFAADCRSSLSIQPGQFVERGDYSFYVPARLKKSAGLVVYLHGCKQPMLHSRKVTRLEEHADRDGFIVVYPEQCLFRNAYKCWNWFYPHNNQRGGTEVLQIVQAIKEIQNEFDLNTKKTFVMGLSAGAAMSSILLACYPDVFAAAAVHAGAAYKAATDLYEASSVMEAASPHSNTQLAQLAIDCMKDLKIKKPLPVLALSGTRDAVVNPKNSDQVVSQFVLASDLLTKGRFRKIEKGTEAITPDSVAVTRGEDTRYAFSTFTYKLSRGQFSQKVIVENLMHAWSGGPDEYPYSDEKGPDATRLSLDFFKLNSQSN